MNKGSNYTFKIKRDTKTLYDKLHDMHLHPFDTQLGEDIGVIVKGDRLIACQHDVILTVVDCVTERDFHKLTVTHPRICTSELAMICHLIRNSVN